MTHAWTVLIVVFAAAIARADNTAPGPDEDPKAAIRERGIVLKAGKRHFVVVVPPAKLKPNQNPPEGSTLFEATMYFGDGKVLYRQRVHGWSTATNFDEDIGAGDPRNVTKAGLGRKGDAYQLVCSDPTRMTKRTFDLAAADVAAIERAQIRTIEFPYRPYLLARTPNGTTYVYVDTPVTAENKDFRLFVGKRGAMKRVPIKEIANDSQGVVLVTARGTLTYKASKAKGCETTQITFGTATKADSFDVLEPYANAKLVYQELGVYPSTLRGFPCDEL